MLRVDKFFVTEGYSMREKEKLPAVVLTICQKRAGATGWGPSSALFCEHRVQAGCFFFRSDLHTVVVKERLGSSRQSLIQMLLSPFSTIDEGRSPGEQIGLT